MSWAVLGSATISCQDASKMWNGLEGSEQVNDAPQAAREPRHYAVQDILRLLYRVLASSGRGVVGDVPLSRGHRKIECQYHHRDEPGQLVRVADLAVSETNVTRLEVGEHRLDAPGTAHSRA